MDAAHHLMAKAEELGGHEWGNGTTLADIQPRSVTLCLSSAARTSALVKAWMTKGWHAH